MRLETVASDRHPGGRVALPAAELAARLAAAAPEGLVIDRGPSARGGPSLAKLLTSTDFAIVLPPGSDCDLDAVTRLRATAGGPDRRAPLRESAR